MRAFRQRTWAAMAVNLTPLIDVVFLIIIFFIIMINFSEMHIRKINLPKADEAKESLVAKNLILPVIIKSKETMYLDRTSISLDTLIPELEKKRQYMAAINIQIMADESVPYEVIKDVLYKLSSAGIGKIEFSTLNEEPDPLQEDIQREN